MSAIIVVDGIPYDENAIRKLRSALEYNRETIMLYREALRDIKVLSTETNSEEGVEAHADS